MKAVLQRVLSASVHVQGELIASTLNPISGSQQGLLVLLGVQNGDSEEDSRFLAKKTVELRIFGDEQGKMNKSLLDVGGSVLVVSQFTLLAEWRQGRRPGFGQAAPPEIGERLYQQYVTVLRTLDAPVQTGRFGADMQVSLVNDGPVTLVLDSKS